MRSNLVKQICICILIVLICGVIVFLVKGYFLPNTNNDTITSPTEIKDKYQYNEYKLVNVTDEMIVQRYLVDFKDKILNSLDEAYKLLDNSTKNKYKDYYDFKDTVNNHMSELKTARVDKYNVQKNKSINKYIIIDQYNNKYIFSAKAVLLYEIGLELNDEIPSIFK